MIKSKKHSPGWAEGTSVRVRCMLAEIQIGLTSNEHHLSWYAWNICCKLA